MAKNIIGDTAAATAGETQSVFMGIINKIPMFFGALAVVFICFMLASLAKNMVRRSLANRNADDNAILMMGKVTYFSVMILGITIALKMLGIDITSIVGLFGVGIGFALQDVIKNFVSGGLILIQKPFHVGDVIKVGEYIGKVEVIESRATFIKTFDGQRVIIPNADVFSTSVTNFSAHPERRLEIAVGVAYGTNLAQAGQIIMNILEHHESVLANPKPTVIFTDFADSSINISAKFWVDRTAKIFAIRSNILQEIKIAFDQSGVNIPFPIRTLHMEDEDMLRVALQSQVQKKVQTPQINPQNVSSPTNTQLTGSAQSTASEVTQNISQFQQVPQSSVDPVISYPTSTDAGVQNTTPNAADFGNV